LQRIFCYFVGKLQTYIKNYTHSIRMLSRPLRLFIEDEIENIFIEENDDANEYLPRSPITRKKEKPKRDSFDYSNFSKRKKKLNNLKKDELSDILRSYKSNISFDRGSYYTRVEIRELKSLYDFSLSGKKEDLLKRVNLLFFREKIAIFMQKRIRGSYTRKLMRLRGPALKNRALCVNDSDFYTLEPIKNIPLESFFSYTGNGNFIYGFDVSSLLSLLKNSRKIQNPYNRESMEPIVNDIYYVERLSKLVHRSIETQSEKSQNPPSVLQYSVNNQTLSLNRVDSILTADNSIRYDPRAMMQKLIDIRSKPVSDRIQAVFMEIDQLGFYTQSSWFNELQRFNYIRFFSGLYDIWHYRAQLSWDTKRKICPLHDPFVRVITAPLHYSHLSEEQLKLMCLDVIEDMIFTGVDNDNRSLGAFHALSALTLVSIPARTSMPWLYESLVF
jgi:hypothetical protein